MTQLPPSRLLGWHLALDRAPLFLSVMLMFLVPFTTQPEGMDPLLPKQALCQMLAFLGLALWCWRAYQTQRIKWVYSASLWPLLALVLWCALTAIFSPCSQIAWGAWESWVCFPLLYFLFTFVCLELWRAENVLIVFMVSALGCALWAVAQAMGLGKGVWLEAVQNQYSGRVIAGMGNPDFLAGFLLLAWPLGLTLFFRARQTITKALWMSVTALTLGALFLTRSKAGILGLGLGAFIFLILFLLKNPTDPEGKNRRNLVWILAGSTFLAGIYPALQILRPLADPQNPSVLFRVQLWSGVWKMVKDHPFTGVGFGAFSAIYPAYRPISLMMSQTQRSYEVNDAHNWVLSWLSQTGGVGLALLFAFWGTVLYQWWKLYQAKAIPPALGAGAFAAFAGIGLDNLFDLNSTLATTLVPLLFIAALPVALSQRFYRLPGFPIQAKETSLDGFRFTWLGLTLLISVLAGYQVWVVFEKQWADVQLKKAIQLSETKEWAGAFKAYDRTLKLDPTNVMALYFRGSARVEAGDWEKAVEDFNQVMALEPDYLLVHYKKAQALQNDLGRSTTEDVEMKRAIQLDPKLVFQLPEYSNARDKVGRKDYRGALMIYQKLVLDYPTCVPALVDEGNCLFLLGRQEEAESAYRGAIQLDPENPEAKQNLLQLLQIQKK